ncbi:MAG: glycosyltransferase family 2 protein [Candidatus Eiseniibacteriota bacterium]|jgi:glycosyltransferase involved in cell wall biosynthesis
MHADRSTTIIIPALDEEASIGAVVEELLELGEERVDRVLVVDNGSTDRTARVAREAGAEVLREPWRGYGAACLRGLAAAAARRPFAVAFLDADRADRPADIGRLLDPLYAGEADLVVGSRVLGAAEPGALTPQARFGNRLAVALIRLLHGHRYTDLGPFRAVRYDALERIAMRDRTFGWTVEMQVRALKRGLRVIEVPVDYRRRVGHSKISGTVRGMVAAGSMILWTIGREALGDR